MAEAYTLAQTDQRNLGTLVSRLIDDLNRPDLQAQALTYIQDAIRYYQRKPFLFNETDNTPTAFWAPSTIYPQGSIIQATVSGTQYAFCALNQGTSDPAVTPTWPATQFTVPSGNASPPAIPPPPIGTAGTVLDPIGGQLPPAGNAILWANVGTWTSTSWTQVSTVYSINQVVPPLDYIAPYRIEVTAANLRYELQWISYNQLRNYDVIRPSPITVYPVWWAWFQQQIYLWPYPNAFFPLTLSYRTAPVLLSTTNQTNFWTTQAERMVRKWAQRALEAELLHDADAAEISKASQMEEERVLRSQAIQQRNAPSAGIPSSDW